MTACTHHWTVTSECPRCLRAQLDAAEAELAEWRDGDRQHPLTVHSYKIMVRYLTDERREAEAERDALRALLQDAEPWLRATEDSPQECDALHARIRAMTDAARKEGEG